MRASIDMGKRSCFTAADIANPLACTFMFFLPQAKFMNHRASYASCS